MLILLKYECKKLFSHKLIPILLLCITIFNSFLVMGEMDVKKLQTEKELDDFIIHYQENPDEMEAYMKAYNDAYELALSSASYGDVNKISVPESVYSDFDYILFNETFAPVRDYTQNYEKTIKKAIRIAKAHLEEYEYVGLLEDSFEVRYQNGVLQSYEKLTDLEFPLINIRGYDILLGYAGYGVLIMVAVLIGGMLILIPEKKGGMLLILRVSKYGRSSTYFAKMMTAFLYCLVVCLLLTGSAFLAVGIRCGFSGLWAPIQMVESFQLCPIMTTVGGGLFISFLLRLFSSFVFMTLVISLSSICKGYVSAFFVGLATTALNYLIANKEYLNLYDPLKNLNFFWSINGKEPLVYWRGILMFDTCIPALTALLFVYVILLIAGFLLSWCFYTWRKGNISRKTTTLFVKQRAILHELLPTRKPKQRVSLIGLEIRKIMTPFSVFVLSSVLVANIVLSYQAYHTRDSFYDIAYDEYMMEYEGEWTEDKDDSLRRLHMEYLQTIDKKDAMLEAYANGEITWQEYGSYNTEYTYAVNRIDVVSDLCETSARLREIHENGADAFFVNERGWLKLRETNFSYLYLLAAILLFSGVFSMGYRYGMVSLQIPTQYGKKRIAFLKIGISCAIIFCILLLCEGYQFYDVWQTTGISMINVSIKNLTFEHEWNLSIGGYFLLMFCRQLFVMIVFSLLTLLISEKTKKTLSTLSIMSIVAFAPLIFNYFGFDFMQYFSIVNLLGRK